MITGYSVLLAPTAANILENKSHCMSQERLLCRKDLERFVNGGVLRRNGATATEYLNRDRVQILHSSLSRLDNYLLQ